MAERVWRSVGDNEFVDGRAKTKITISIGIAFFPTKNVANVEQLLANADHALFQAKRQGRNRICLYQQINYLYRPEGPAP